MRRCAACWRAGGAVIATAPIAREFAGNSAGKSAGNSNSMDTQVVASGRQPLTVVYRIATARGTLLAVDGSTVESIFADANAGWAAPIWLQTLHHPAQTNGYTVAFGGVTLLYSIAPLGAALPFSNHSPATLTIYDTHGVARQTMRLAGRSGTVRVTIARRSYALVTTAPNLSRAVTVAPKGPAGCVARVAVFGVAVPAAPSGTIASGTCDRCRRRCSP